MNHTVEIWKPIPEYPGYQVSDLGNVRSCHCLWRWAIMPWKKLRPVIGGGGYYAVTLRNKVGRVSVRIHTLVLRVFVGERPTGYHGCHNDGNKTNNRLDNLRWDTPKMNVRDADLHGLVRRGSKVNTAKVSEDDVREMRRRAANKQTTRELAALYGLDISQVNRILSHKSWRHI